MRHRAALIIFFGLGFGVVSASYFSTKDRKIASVEKKRSWMPAPIGKHLALFEIEITALSEISENESEDITIVGKIYINQPVQDQVTYSWQVPADVEVIKGDINGKVAQPQQGQFIETKLIVRGFNKKMQKLISLKALSRSANLPIGSSAVIVSRPEDTLEYVAAEMKQSADEQLHSSAPKARR